MPTCYLISIHQNVLIVLVKYTNIWIPNMASLDSLAAFHIHTNYLIYNSQNAHLHKWKWTITNCILHFSPKTFVFIGCQRAAVVPFGSIHLLRNGPSQPEMARWSEDRSAGKKTKTDKWSLMTKSDDRPEKMNWSKRERENILGLIEAWGWRPSHESLMMFTQLAVSPSIFITCTTLYETHIVLCFSEQHT